MIEGIIYRALSPSNKKYYGYSLDLNGRKRRYIRALMNGDKNRFYDALRKYGIENFTWSIIEIHYRENKKDIHDILCEREIFWIAKDKTYLPEFGYNMTKGGDGRLGSTMSEETKANLIKKLTGRTTERKGKNFKQEMIEKYGEIVGLKKYEIWIKQLKEAKIGKNQSIEHIEKRRKLLTGKKRSIESKENIKLGWIKRKNNKKI